MMIKPSIDQLTNGGEMNRYELVIATSKVARVITDEYCEQRERAEAMIRNGETDKNLGALIKGDIRDKKAVENAAKDADNLEDLIKAALKKISII